MIHPTAIVDEGAIIGSGTNIWHWTHVSSGARVGENCSLGQNVYVGSKSQIGNGVKIQNNVSIYDSVILEDDVFCGPSAVFTNVYNPRSFIPRKQEYKTTYICKGASLGANSTIVCGVKIGSFAFVGAGAVVTSDVKPYALVVGVPARQIGWMTRSGQRIELPLSGDGLWQCPSTGETYKLVESQIYFSGIM